jgi:hypothetical protein
MSELNTEIDDFRCEINEDDLNDMRDIIQIGKVAWSPKQKQTVVNPDVPVFRIYTPYDPDNSSNISFAVADAPYFPLQPSFYRCCASTGNRHLYAMFEGLINQAITSYGKPFSMVACILTEDSVSPHVHFVDPDKNVILTTYYWTLTNKPIDSDFLYERQRSPLYKQGYLTFDPSKRHGVEDRDGNMRFYVLIDSL